MEEANQTIVLQNLQITTLRDEFEAARKALVGGPPSLLQPGSSEQKQRLAQMPGDMQIMGTQFIQPQLIQPQQNMMVEPQQEDGGAKNNMQNEANDLVNSHYR